MSEAALKAARAAKKQAVSLRIRNLRRLMAEDERVSVETKKSELKLAFSEFESVALEYGSILNNPQTVKQNEVYIANAEKDYVEALKEVQTYLKDVNLSMAMQPKAMVASPAGASGESRPEQDGGLSGGSSGFGGVSTTSMFIETYKPECFNGDSLKYPMWKASVDAFMSCQGNVSYSVKMFHLRNFITGEALSAIESCFLSPNRTTYDEAWSILEERFGNAVLVTSAFRKKIDDWPKIGDRDRKALQQFSDFLKQVQVASLTFEKLSVLDDEFENEKLVKKLPNWLASKWIAQVVRNTTTFPKFKRFVEFISEHAKISNHSLWGSTNQIVTRSVAKRTTATAHAGVGRMPGEGDDGPGRVLMGNGDGSPSLRGVRRCPCCDEEGHMPISCPLMISKTLPDRLRLVAEKRLCFGCLHPGHQLASCKYKTKCKSCHRSHHDLLHREDKVAQNVQKVESHASHLYKSFCKATDSKSVSALALPVIVSHGDKRCTVLALLDTMSNTHFISKFLVDYLQLEGTQTTLDLRTMHGRKVSPAQVHDDVRVMGVYEGAPTLTLDRCFEQDVIPFDGAKIPTPEMLKMCPHLSDISLPDNVRDLKVGLLIGDICSAAFKPLPETIRLGTGDEPWAYMTKLGWCIQGPYPLRRMSSSCTGENKIAMRTLCKEVILGRVDRPETGVEDAQDELVSDLKYSADDSKFLKIMDQGFKQTEDGCYSCPLPLKKDAIIPNNRDGALKRLSGLEARLKRDPEYRRKYVSVVEEMISLGFAEVAPSGTEVEAGMINYIPHHGVVKPSDPSGPPRVVFDCSFQYMGVSLNDVLLQGPNLLNRMLGILMRFRLGKVGFVCDIQKMYYQFKVDAHHRDLLRFLWWPNGDLSREPVEYRMTVHIFGAVSSSGVATYGLRRIVDDHGHRFSDEAAEFIRRDFYVDDGQSARDSDEDAHKVFDEAQKLLASGGCKAHKVMSNSTRFMELVEASDHAKCSDDGMYKALGVPWNVELDKLCILFNIKDAQLRRVTRRIILSTLAAIYDPMGFVAPLVLIAKLMFQELCGRSCTWDEIVPPEIHNRFVSWLGELTRARQVVVQRCQIPDFEVQRVELHHFADASTTAYAACSYLRFVGTDGNVHVSLVIGKCKVVPIKPVFTVPRLELMAAVLACRLALLCRQEIPWRMAEYFWSDSTVVLGYVKNTSARFKVFVANRVQFIHNVSSPEQWRHCVSAENPADDGSRAVQTKRWLDGPAFLYGTFEESQLDDYTIGFMPDEELCMNQTVPTGEPIAIYHDWFSTKKMVAWMMRFAHNARKGSSVRTGIPPLLELDHAEKRLVLMVQEHHFFSEKKSLSITGKVHRDSRLYNLGVFLDDEGLIRVRGRATLSAADFNVKHPVVIPGESDVAHAIVEYFHRLVHHQGRGITAGEVRSHGFWILGLGPLVKRLLRNCVPCKRLRGRPMEQKMADLPEARVSPSEPFTLVGCDNFGPFHVKNGRRQCKRYGLIFTCLYSRAVHLEMVYELSTDSFINAYRRFVSLRGPVKQLFCDQGTNFVGGEAILLKMGTDVKFNAPKASHAGGVWERMIGVSRRIIEGILLEHGEQLDDESLLTIFAETAAIVNSRPLNVLGLEDSSLEPLTPNHLIMMKAKVSGMVNPDLKTDQPDLYAVKRWKRVQYLSDLFWSRWKKEILQNLQKRSKWNEVRRNARIDDTVLMVDENSHRSFWKLGRIVAVHVSDDGLVRAATVKLANGTTLDRPVQKLIFMTES